MNSRIPCVSSRHRVWKSFYVPPARKLVFSLQLRVAQCCVLRYRGMKCKNWTAHAPIVIQRSTIFFLFFFFFVQRKHPTDKASYIRTAHALPYYNTLLLHKIDKMKMAGTSRKIPSVMISAANNYNTRLDSSVRVYAPKSHKIEYVPMHTNRLITRLA